MFWSGQTSEVTLYIRASIWSPSGSDYLLNHNKTTHSIFLCGEEWKEILFISLTHSLVYDSWVRSWSKSQSQQKDERFSARGASRLHQSSARSGAPSLMNWPIRQVQWYADLFFSKKKKKFGAVKTQMVIKAQYRSLIDYLHGFDHCLSFLSDVIYGAEPVG